MRRLVIAVSGTPGTGKSAFARALAGKLGARLVDLNALITKEKIYSLDTDGTKAIDVKKIREAFKRDISASAGPIVAEGLLAHLLPKGIVTHVVVLRTNPKELEKRLIARGYSEKKVTENVEAEALDIILWEAVHAHGLAKVYEIDTTRSKAPTSVKLFLRAMKGEVSLRPGRVAWLENYLKTR